MNDLQIPGGADVMFRGDPRKTGIGRNPRTGEEVNIPPGKAVRFKPGKELQGIEESKKTE
jgi:nucleoid DNA-binding protein